jgi:UDP-N-acetyl-D-glucosamine dehydrogenase
MLERAARVAGPPSANATPPSAAGYVFCKAAGTRFVWLLREYVETLTVSADHVSSRIRSREATVAVVGLGLVGVAQAGVFMRAGFRVLGIDVNSERVGALSNGARPADLDEFWKLSDSYESLRDADCVIIATPTGYEPDGTPDVRAVAAASRDIGRNLHGGMLVVLESTVPPGTTREVVLPALEASGLRAGSDFFLAFSPERIDPGSTAHPVESIPKLVGGITAECGRVAIELYRFATPEVHAVSSPEIAELAKVFENTFRFVNISLANELAIMCGAIGLDVQEVIDAASTKPFAFMAHRPGPGVGGRCIPMAPRYLSWAAQRAGAELPVTEAAIALNDSLPRRVAKRALALAGENAASTVLLLGVAYKPNIDDTRGSVALEVAAELMRSGASVLYHDPHVAGLTVGGKQMRSQPLTAELLESVDAAILLCPHKVIDLDFVVGHVRVILDPTGRLRPDAERVFGV